MHDLKLLKVINAPVFNISPDELKTPACKEASLTFLRNANRATRILQAPVFAAGTAGVYQAAVQFAMADFYGTENPTDEQMKIRLPADFGDKCYAQYVKMLSSTEPGQHQLIMASAANNLCLFLQVCPKDVHDIFESLLKTTIILAWTATETLLEDLWERALNEHPSDLCKVTPPDKAKKGILSEEIQKYGFNLRNKMGTILKGRFKFHTLTESRMAYETAFSTDGGQVNKAIKNGYVDSLYHLRNLIAHNSGIVDSHFLEETKDVKLLSDIRALGANNPILFDGEMTTDFVGKGINCGFELLKSVDKWLIDHPTP